MKKLLTLSFVLIAFSVSRGIRTNLFDGDASQSWPHS